MATRIDDGKRLPVQQHSKRSATPPPRRQSGSQSNMKKPSGIASPPTASINQLGDTLVARTVLTQKTRLVVVRTTNSIQDENGEKIENEELPRSKSVEFPPVFTNGRTSVYLIRRPIPPPETSRQTLLYRPEDFDEKTRETTPDDARSPTPTEEIILSPDSASQNQPSFERLKSSNRSLSSAEQSGNSQRRTRRPRSGSKSRRRGSRRRSRSMKRRVSWNHHSPTPPLAQEESIELNQKRSFSSSKQTKSIATQADLIPSVTVETGRQSGRRVTTRRLRRKQRTQSDAFIISDDQTTTQQRPRSSKNTRFSPDSDSQSTEELVKTSRWQTCFSCLLRHMCLVILICLILILIGLSGVGVSAYFLAINSQNNFIPTIVGITVGGSLVILSLCFLYCILGCLGSREGFFTYRDDGPQVGGRAFALISSAHPNIYHYTPREYTEISDNKRTTSFLKSVSTISTTQQPVTINRQRTTVHEINGTINKKNVLIEMPERLLTGRKMSPKTHERKLSNVVHNIGHVVEVTKKRYHGETPKKFIIKVNENVKSII